MSQQIIITVFAEDRPGIIRDISTVILNHQGNWLDSSLSQLAGKFAGIILVSA
ncbi:MAG: glycine cleavage system protein R, partial [Proteobacteria bacterium]|nr:glycine cleavage system protein R [Pseudomonadota bacterium]